MHGSAFTQGSTQAIKGLDSFAAAVDRAESLEHFHLFHRSGVGGGLLHDKEGTFVCHKLEYLIILNLVCKPHLFPPSL